MHQFATLTLGKIINVNIINRESFSNLWGFSYVTASMALYAPLIMKAMLSPDAQVRTLSLNVADLLLEQGVVHPVEVNPPIIFLFVIALYKINLFQCVPSLIAITVDPQPELAEKALQLLKGLDEKYPSFLQARISQGLQDTFLFLQSLNEPGDLLKGNHSINRYAMSVYIYIYIYSIYAILWCLLRVEIQYRLQ